MAADNPWFWILMLTGAGLVAAAVVLHVRRMRRSRDMAGVIGDHEILMYLNEALVMDILQYRGDVRALKRRVEQYTRETAEGRGEVKSSLFSIVGGRNREGSTTESFEAEESPITAIRKVVRELEKADAIVYADFHKGEIHPHRTLTDNPAGVAKLSDSRMLLSIDGRFEEYEEGDGSDKDYARLRAPYPPATPMSGSRSPAADSASRTPCRRKRRRSRPVCSARWRPGTSRPVSSRCGRSRSSADPARSTHAPVDLG
ncbi:hypothetical protein ACFQ0O_24895 [Saccharopolyspora spinosporotrichia]